MPGWDSEETQQASAISVVFPDTAPTASERREAADRLAAMSPLPDSERERQPDADTPPLLGPNLGLATTRELLEELEARGRLLGGYDGRQMVNVIGPWLRSASANLSATVLEYRTVDLDASQAAKGRDWRDVQIASEAGYYTALGRCTPSCRHATPAAALMCNAAEELRGA